LDQSLFRIATHSYGIRKYPLILLLGLIALQSVDLVKVSVHHVAVVHHVREREEDGQKTIVCREVERERSGRLLVGKRKYWGKKAWSS
jgi:hypothetical protein